MKFALSRAVAAASFVFAAPLLAVSALASEPNQETTEQTDQTQAEEQVSEEASATASTIEIPAIIAPASGAPASAQEPEEEERICRSVRLDMSSRRKTRVCLTEQGWRDLNQQR